MMLDEIVLHDFCAYAGKNTICLTPLPGKPVILFGGLNGAGKTTIMDALQLCLFGAAAQCAGRANSTYHDYLGRAIYRGALYKQASVSAVFRRFAEGKEARYRVTRIWKKSGSSIKESLDVTIDKTPAPAVARNWEAHVNQIMPANIAHLFFFDGEKAALYASPESARDLVQTGVYGLLGMDIVEQTDRDLKTLERRRRAEKLPEIDRKTILEKEKETGELQNRAVLLAEKCAEIQTRIIDSDGRKCMALKKSYRDLGGDLRDRGGKIRRRLQKSQLCLSAINTRMQTLAEGKLPLLLISDVLPWLDEKRQQEHESRIATLLTDTLESRDQAMIKRLSKTAATRPAIAVLQKFSAADISQRRTAAKTNILLDMGDSAAATVSELIDGHLTHLSAELAKIIKQWKKWTAIIGALETEFHSIPEEDVFAENLRTQDSLLANIKRAEGEITTLRQEQENIRTRIEKLNAGMQAITEKNALAESAHKDLARFLQHSQNARRIMGEFKREVVRRHIHRIEELVLESYLTLMRKQSLVGKVSINPDTFDVTLHDATSRPLAAEQLSKGEQQLLAVALLWGMARASGKSLPMAIDTPLGRLDSEHRARLVKHYFGCAARQVLLFSTDEEIVGNYLQMLTPYIGKRYLLSYDDSTGCTSVSEGALEKS